MEVKDTDEIYKEIEEDTSVMAEQGMITNILQMFLDSDRARRFNITGLTTKVEDGFVNTIWHFGERYSKDIKTSEEIEEYYKED